ncbi:MAG: T9SS type A sorting domain-containing protein, partial [Saprospiraceae bacterium]|nr:T9SS type A sorting domain-containing protein [Saprospiraceae bacterium]
EPYEVIIEAFDSCHNKGMDTCYILIKDQTRPVAVAHDTLTLSLSGKKVWAFPESFDKNSWDNCSQDLLLFLRRTDWQSFCLGDPCDSLVAIPGTASMLDTVDCAYLSDDEGTAPIEAYYSTYLDWLANDGGYCSQLLSQAWMYDLCRMAEVGCNNVEDYDFRSKFQRAFGIEDLDALVQLGGGWADGVPFGCEDLCSEVTVEMLVMDYWCNWSKTWTEVTIEDKTAPSVLQSLTDTVEISCFAYENDAHYAVDGVAGLLTLEELFALAAGGSASAQDSVDALLGSYQGAWLTAAGTYEDANGNALVNSIEFEDRGICKLDTVEERVRYLDLASEMMREKTDSMVERYRFDTTEIQIRPGYVLSPCSQNLQESRSILFAEDNCGNPVITRNFKFWKECNGIVPVKAPDTLRVSQVIRTVLHCEFGLGLFQVPFDTIVSVASCMDIPAIADTLASGIADPDVTGDAMLIFDEACRDVGINRSDRIKTAQPSFQTLCDQVIYRKWIVADWCTEEQDTVVQRIAFRIMSSPEPRAVVHSEQSALVIKQAYPNPFREQTIVGLDIDQSMEVQLVVSNVEGRTVWRSPKQLEQGEYLLSIGRADLPGPGMYFYQVFLDGMLYQTDKIILLD